MGLGALLIFLGVALFSSRLVRPLAQLLGWPAARVGGAAGFLARDNARRNPQRTASTAAALMIGLALVTLVATLASGIVTSFRGAVEDLFTGDYAITAQNNFSPIRSTQPRRQRRRRADRRGERPRRRGAPRRRGRVHHRRRSGNGRSHRHDVDRGLAGRHPLARRGRCLRGRGLRGGRVARARVADRHHVPERGSADRPRRGHLRPTDRRVAVRRGHDLRRSMGCADSGTTQSLLVPEDGGWRDGREQQRSTRLSPTSPTRRCRPATSSSTTRSAA